MKQLKSLKETHGLTVLDSGDVKVENTYYTYMIFDGAYILFYGDCYYSVSIETDAIPVGSIDSVYVDDKEKAKYNYCLSLKKLYCG